MVFPQDVKQPLDNALALVFITLFPNCVPHRLVGNPQIIVGDTDFRLCVGLADLDDCPHNVREVLTLCMLLFQCLVQRDATLGCIFQRGLVDFGIISPSQLVVGCPENDALTEARLVTLGMYENTAVPVLWIVWIVVIDYCKRRPGCIDKVCRPRRSIVCVFSLRTFVDMTDKDDTASTEILMQ